MEPTIMFSALSQAILGSMLHGLYVYLFMRLIIRAFPELPAYQRYRIFYTALIWIFASFIISFSETYFEGIEKSSSSLSTQLISQKEYSAAILFNEGTLLPDYSKWIAVIYFTGLLTQSIFLLFGLFRINTIREDSKRKPDLTWNSRLKVLSQKLAIEKKVSIYLSGEMLIPFTVGFIKPIILFPIAMINSLSQEETEAILLHELAHIRRNDYLYNIIQRIMEMILFFNPVVWLLGKDIRREREFCCDDLVVANTSNPEIYAHALLQIAENKSNNLQLSLSASGKEKYSLLNRIKRLTNMKPLNSNPKHRLFTSISVVAVCLSLAWIVPVEHAIRQKSDNSNIVKTFISDTIPPVPPVLPNAPEPLATLMPPAPFAPVAQVTSETRVTPVAPLAPVVPVTPLDPAIAPKAPLAPATPFPLDTNDLKKKFRSSEWKKKMEAMKANAEEMKKKFNNPEWKKEMEAMKANAEEMKKKFDSPEWKKKMEVMKANAEEMKKKFDSPEWKKQMEAMKANAEEMKKKFDSPEWKKQMEAMQANAEEMKKKFDSPEWKKQMEAMKANAEEMKKKFDSPEWKKEMEKLQKNKSDMIK